MTIVNIRPGTRWVVVSRGVTPAELDLVTGGLVTIEADLAAVVAEVTAARDGLTDLDTRLDALRDAGLATQAEVTAAREGEASLDAKLDLIESNTASADAALASYDASLDIRIDAKADTTVLNSAISTLTSADAGLDTRLEALEGEPAELVISFDERPGDALELYSTTLTGSQPPSSNMPLTDDDVATTADGRVARLTDRGIVAQRGMFGVEPGLVYEARAAFRRSTDTTDPSNDALRIAVAWYNSSKGQLTGSDTVIGDYLDLTIAMGRQTVEKTLAKTAAEGIDLIIPASAVYGRLYAQQFGETAVTDIEVLHWGEPTGAANNIIIKGSVYDAAGTLAERTAYDAEAEGFVFLRVDHDPMEFYIRDTATPGVWIGPYNNSEPGAGLPDTGTAAAGDVVRWTGAAAEWDNILLSPALLGNPTAPTAPPGDATTTVATTAFVDAASAVPITVVGGTSYTLSQADHHTIIDFSSNAQVTVIVPSGLTLPFEVRLSQAGNGQVSVTPASGVTINEPDFFRTTEKRYAQMVLTAFSPNNYRLRGRTAETFIMDILELFPVGTEGAVWDATDISTMWADTAGTIPASVNGYVRRIDDITGNGHHLILAADANILRRDKAGFLNLEIPAVGGFLAAASADYPLPLPHYMMMTFKRAGETSGNFIGMIGGPTSYWRLQNQSGGAQRAIMNWRSPTNAPPSITPGDPYTVPINAWVVVDSLVDEGSLDIDVNSAGPWAVANAGFTGTLAAGRLGIQTSITGDAEQSTGPVKLNFVCGIVRDGGDNAQRSSIQMWGGAKARIPSFPSPAVYNGAGDFGDLADPFTTAQRVTLAGDPLPDIQGRFTDAIETTDENDDPCIYMCPYQSPGIGKVHLPTMTFTVSAMGSGMSGTGMKFAGAAKDASGNVYFPGYDAAGMVKINRAAGTASILSDGGLPLGGGKHHGACSARSGRFIVTSPYAADFFCIYDTSDGSFYYEDWGLDMASPIKYCGIIEAPDGRLFTVPWGVANLIIITPNDGLPSTWSAVQTTLGGEVGTGYFRGTVHSSGKLIYAPRGAYKSLIITPDIGGTDTAERTNWGLSDLVETNQKYSGCVEMSNGLVYHCPRESKFILTVDVASGTGFLSDYGIADMTTGGGKWESMFKYGNDAYCLPYQADDWLKITTVPA